MASENEASCESDPNFAVICGFLEKFGVVCGLANIDFVDLQEMLENSQEVSQELIELHVKLMRRARKSVPSNDKWERALIKTCHTFSSQDAWEFERFGYKKARIGSKLRVLKELLEMQFDYNQKFKNEINKMSATDLRTQPIGKDRMGRAYWYQCDENCQIRVYKDDPDDETWTLIAKDRGGLVSLISQLSNGDTVKSSSEPVSNEDSNSLEVEKPTLDTGQSKSSSPEPEKFDSEGDKMQTESQSVENNKEIGEDKIETENMTAEQKGKVDENQEKIEEKQEEINIKESNVTENFQEGIKEHAENVEEAAQKRIETVEGNVCEEKFSEEKFFEEKFQEEKLFEEKFQEEKLFEEKFQEQNTSEENIFEENCENALNLCSKDLSNKEDNKDEKACLDLSLKTSPCLRIKPITELMAQPQYIEAQKKEFMGIKGKYIRTDSMDKGLLYPNPSHLGKAVQSASYDAICYKRAMEDEIYSVPTNLKHPRFDRPTLLGNKKYMSYMNEEDDEEDEDDEDDEEVEDEIEEPLMLVQGEGSGFPNESFQEKEEESPIVSEEIEETVLYVFGEGSGKECETGNKCSEESEENKDRESADNPDNTSTKNQLPSTKSHYKPGTIIDSKTNTNTKKSRWDIREDPVENTNTLEGVNNSSENFLDSNESDNVNSECEAIKISKETTLETAASPSKQTFFFGNRSPFASNTSPIKTASLSFGASTVNDNQNVITTNVSEKYYEVESSSILLDKTDENLVGNNPSSHTKVPQNVDIENIDNNETNVSKRLLVIENEDVSKECVFLSEHEQNCDKFLANVSDISNSEIQKDKNCADKLEEVKIGDSSRSTEVSVKQKEVTKTDLIETCSDDLELKSCRSLISVEKHENILKTRKEIEITKYRSVMSSVEIRDDLQETTGLGSLFPKSHRYKNSMDTKPNLNEVCRMEERVSSTVVEDTTYQECKITNELKTSEENENVSLSPDSCVEDQEVLKEIELNKTNEVKNNTEEQPKQERKKSSADDVPTSTSDVQQTTNETDSDSKNSDNIESTNEIKDNTNDDTTSSISSEYNTENDTTNHEMTKEDEGDFLGDDTSNSVDFVSGKNSNENMKRENPETSQKVKRIIKDSTLKSFDNDISSEGSENLSNEFNDSCSTESKDDVDINIESDKIERHNNSVTEQGNTITNRNNKDFKNKLIEMSNLTENTTDNDGKESQINAINKTISGEKEFDDFSVVSSRVTKERDYNFRANTKNAKLKDLQNRDVKDLEKESKTTTKSMDLSNTDEIGKMPPKENLFDDDIDKISPDDNCVSSSDSSNHTSNIETQKSDITNTKSKIMEKDSTDNKDVEKKSEKELENLEEKKSDKFGQNHTSPAITSSTNNKESSAEIIENEDETGLSGIAAIKAIRITNVQAKCDILDKPDENKLKTNESEGAEDTNKSALKSRPAEPQPLRFLRGRRPNQMLSVKSYATRNKNLVLRKETKPQIQKPVVPNNMTQNLCIVKIEENVDNYLRRSTRRKPGDNIEKNQPVAPLEPLSIETKKQKGRSRKGAEVTPEIKNFEETDVRYSKRLRLSNNQIPSSTDVETIDLTSESDNKHNVKKGSMKNCNENVHLKKGLTIKPIYKEQKKEEEKKLSKKNGPFLSCVNIQKLKESPPDHIDSPLSVESSGGGDNSDVVIIEDDPLAMPDSFERKPVTLNSFQLDVDYTQQPSPIMTRSLRKRGRTEPEIIIPTGGKRRKTKGKRQVDLELRRSIEEQKKQELSSSEEEKKEESPKRKPQSYKIMKQEVHNDNVDVPKPQPVKKPRAAKKKTLLGLDIPDIIEPLETTIGNVRQSRRIAQMKIKEEAERRKLDDLTMTEQKEVKRKGKKNIDKDYKSEKRKRIKAPTEEEVTVDVPEVEEKKKRRKRKRKHKDPRKIFDESNPWRSSSGSSSSNDEVEEEEEEIAEYSEAESPLFKSDHEFSPESDIEDTGESLPLKRARTARKENDVENAVDDHACQKCGKSDHPEWILLCDGCDNGWHCSCLRPALLVIPEGDWFCPPCQHNNLVKQLEEKLVEYDKKLAKREIEERRKERLAYVGISLANVLPVKDIDEKKKKNREDDEDDEETVSEESDSSSESSSSSDSDEPIYQLRQRRQAHSYRFNDYDDLINSAIQDEMEAVKGAGNQGRGKDISTIVNAEKEEQVETDKQEFETLPPVVPVESKELPPAVVPPDHNDTEEEKIKPIKKFFGRKKQRKLNCLDVSSGDDDNSDEDFKGSSSEEDDDEFEDLGSDSSEGFGRRKKGMPVRRSTRARTSRYDRDFINDDSEDDIPRKKKSKSAWDDSETEESDRSWGRSSRRKVKRFSAPRKKRSKKSKKHFDDSDDDRSKKKKRRIKYGGLDDDDEDEEAKGRRTRGKKINYADVLASDSEDEVKRKVPPRIESDDDYVANDDQEQDDEEFEKEESVEKEETPEEKESEETTPLLIENPELKEPAINVVEPPPATNVVIQEPVVPEVISEPPQQNFDIDNLNSSLDDLPDEIPDDNDDDDNELNPIEEINKNLEEMDEAEMEKLMEEEEYANKQLQLMAMQLEKEKKRREREAKKKEMTSSLDPKLPKKRGRKNKSLENENQEANTVEIGALQVGPDMHNNPELSEPPGVTIPIFSEMQHGMEGSPKKRRGRGKGKKTLEKEQAAAAAAASVGVTTGITSVSSSIASENLDDQTHIPTTVDTVASINSGDLSLANVAAMHGAKLAIAAPPQPFSQTQPTPSVITRMLQAQPAQGSYSPMGMGLNYYADQPPQQADNSPTPPVSNSQMSASVPVSSSMTGNPNGGQVPSISQQQYMHGTPPRGITSTVYRQPPSNINPYQRTSPAPSIRIRNPAPSIPPVYHSHHPLDPSPSGGGPINVSANSMNTPDRSSPISIPPSSDSPLSNKSDQTPPPPPYSRPQMRFSSVNATPLMAASPIRQQQNLLPPQHMQSQQQQPQPLRNNLPYHPANIPSNYYGGYMTGSMGSEESLPPSGYPYSDQFSETNSPQDISKSYDEENSGEFGGLVSYFSSQREDDLDT